MLTILMGLILLLYSGITVTFSGTLIPVGTPLALPQGWNLSYPLN